MKTVKLYEKVGFVNCLVIMDMEFEKAKDKVGLLEVNTSYVRTWAELRDRFIS